MFLAGKRCVNRLNVAKLDRDNATLGADSERRLCKKAQVAAIEVLRAPVRLSWRLAQAMRDQKEPAPTLPLRHKRKAQRSPRHARGDVPICELVDVPDAVRRAVARIQAHHAECEK
jgi:hypothetical protein